MDDLDELFDAFDGNASTAAETAMETERIVDAKEEANAFISNLRRELGDDETPKRTHDMKKETESDDAETPKRKRTKKEAIDEPEDDPNIEFVPTQIVTLATNATNCTHEVALPPRATYVELSDKVGEPAKTYPFPLDNFQKQAIRCIDNNRSVLVSAHTSAGKTVVAQYAIAQALRDKQRVIYTSPIKALSNQKYRELEEEFGDVGLMTGDVTMNPEASCLVMTTEILRSMLYRGAQIMREVGWVVFDEIHYMRDKERGVVWEETIILLPNNVRYVFLSATIPNARQFAEWVAVLHHQCVHVVYTDYRPTPLQHFVYPSGGDGLYEVVNVQNVFQESKFNEAMACIKPGAKQSNGRIQKLGGGRGTQGDSSLVKIIRTVSEHDMLPCIVFSFSRRECEAYATSIKDMDFIKDDQKTLVGEIYRNAVSLLNDDDKKLPQIGAVLPLLRRGIGIHHSGLLPLLKETIEILFGEGLLKILFATETFAMGLNMPARTVVFTSARKFDGKANRSITSGEYIQMSGRAGRRGKDTKGLVILMVDEQMGADDAKHIIKGATDPLNSQFRLTYNMVLNLLRVDGINPEFMLENSFHQFQNYQAIPGLENNVRRLKDELEGMSVPDEQLISSYRALEKAVADTRAAIHKIVFRPKYVVPFLQPGRLIKVRSLSGGDFGWGVVVQHHRKLDGDKPVYLVDVLLGVSPASVRDRSNVEQVQPAAANERPVYESVPVLFDCIYAISQVRVKLPRSLESQEERALVGQMLVEVDRRFEGSPPALDPVKDMRITEEALAQHVQTVEAGEKRLKEHPAVKSKRFQELSQKMDAKLDKKAELDRAKRALNDAKSILQLAELTRRKRVLRRLQFSDAKDIITDKGRVACEISAADELLLTEMLYENFFSDLDFRQTAALLSCFVFQEKGQTPRLAEELASAVKKMQEFARRVALAEKEAKLEVDEQEYVDRFKTGLMDVVFQWADGVPFGDVLKSTDIFEGSIIRCLRRLEELLREMTGAAKAMANEPLREKFERARTAIKRDIVFAASLYL